MVFQSYTGFLAQVAMKDVAADMLLTDVCDVMVETGVATLGVTDAGQRRGVITEADLLRHVSQNGGLSSTPVARIMRACDS